MWKLTSSFQQKEKRSDEITEELIISLWSHMTADFLFALANFSSQLVEKHMTRSISSLDMPMEQVDSLHAITHLVNRQIKGSVLAGKTNIILIATRNVKDVLIDDDMTPCFVFRQVGFSLKIYDRLDFVVLYHLDLCNDYIF